MEKSRDEALSPLATAEAIQKRLVRPSSLPSQSCTSINSRHNIPCYLSQFNLTPNEFSNKRGEEETFKKLEDYLDPILLSAIRSEIGAKRIKTEHTKSKRGGLKELDQFEWPVEELQVFRENLNHEKEKMKRNRAVDLHDDHDFVRDECDDDEEVCCTPFRRFEKTALKRFGSGVEG